jgi:ferric-dicitrate binding protein FerR (iron transport regulator)
MSEHRPTNPTPEDERVRQALRNLERVQPASGFRERLKREFVSGTIAPRQAPVRERGLGRRWLWAALPLAAMILLSILFVNSGPRWILRGAGGEGTITINGRAMAARPSPELSRLLVPEAHIEVAAGASIELLCPDILLLALTGGTDATIPRNPRLLSGHTLTARVDRGELLLKTGPEFPGFRLRVFTAESLTEVSGTTVSVYKGEDFTCVCVLTGVASIGADETSLEEIPAGQRKVLFADGRPPQVTEIAAEHQQGLEEFEKRSGELY